MVWSVIILWHTLSSKRKYTLWVSASRYSKPRSGGTHDRVWGTARTSPNPNITKFEKKIQSGSNVVKQSLKACALSAINTEVNDKNRFLWPFWLDFPINFSLELLSQAQARLLQNSDSQFLKLVWVSSPPTFWVLTGKQSVYCISTFNC